MPTLSDINVHPEVCARLALVHSKRVIVTASSTSHTRANHYRTKRASDDYTKSDTNATTNGAGGGVSVTMNTSNNYNHHILFRQHHRVPTPLNVLKCPLDSLRMRNKTSSGIELAPVPLAKAARLRRDIAQALADYHHNHNHRFESRTEDGGIVDHSVRSNALKFGGTEQQLLEGPQRKRRRRGGQLVTMRELLQRQDDDNLLSFPRCLPTGCTNLDGLLTFSDSMAHNQNTDSSKDSSPNSRQRQLGEESPLGGIPLGCITLVVGPPESGKTQFICHLCKQSIGRYIQRTNWMLCSGPLIPQASRLAEMVEAMKVPREIQQAVMDRTIMRTFRNEWDILSVLTEIEICLQHGSQSPVLLAVDSLGPYDFDSSSTKRIGGRLRYLARRYSIAVVVVESTISDGQQCHDQKNDNGGAIPCFTYDLRLVLSRCAAQPKSFIETKDSSFAVRVVVEHHAALDFPCPGRSLFGPCERSCFLTVQSEGVL